MACSTAAAGWSKVLDLIYADIAEETLGRIRGGTKSRAKSRSFQDSTYNALLEDRLRHMFTRSARYKNIRISTPAS
jgi:hypothetical protein